ncbi:zinc finger protein 888-like [Plodia interpunctella]|uniref:zinc finger protein 888-like n=1 Tax=Plodia interpunctella TaxID=58824 RepID=UPI002367D380|nr:zinc finger protein 888-like [Plodia interpunctella]XP_053623476.1 zinc finger protein 888-like [Plodia interpunctella]XP_053623478.1 zinc finger protein 888-like [Plodia interpunctella]
MNINTDIDPLSNYDYTYDYNSHPLRPYTNLQPVKQEQPMINQEFLHHFMDNVYRNDRQCTSSQDIQYVQAIPNTSNVNQNNENICNDAQNEKTVDEDIKPLIDPKKIKKEKGRKSSYFSEKIMDNDFKFYGCSVCDISFSVLHELDQHVTTHKDRITSYDLKIKNQIRRKNLKKDQKKKKLAKNVKVENEVAIDIKPEDGYIGNEKASEYQNENNENNVNDSRNSTLNNTEKGISNGNLNSGNTLGNGNSENIDNDSKSDVKNSLARVKQCEDNQTDVDITNLAKIYKCFACKKQFTLSYYLKLHVRSHTDEKPYTCSVCGQSFITASKLGRHNKRMHLSVRYQCRICYRFFSRFECLTKHFDNKHPDDKLEGEPYDYNAILPYLKELEEQLKEKTEDTKQTKTEDLWGDWPAPIDNGRETLESMEQKPLEIIVDGDMPHIVQIKKEEPSPEFEAVKDSDSVKSERDRDNEDQYLDDSFQNDNSHNDSFNNDSHVDVKEDVFKEEDGNVSDDNYFPSNTWVPPTPKVEIDEPTTRGRKATPLTCDICHKKISSITYMRIHMRTHTGERPFKCYLCNRGFITSSKLHRHVLTHSEAWEGKLDGEDEIEGNDEEDTEAGEGDEKVKKKSGKKDKKKNKIKKAKAEFAAKSKSAGKRSKKWQHSCQFCHRKFLHAETLEVHKKCHTGEEAVPRCQYCLLPVLDAAARARHEAAHAHAPARYQCLRCGKLFRRREAMIYHKKQHDNDELYCCEICLKSFNAQCKLQRHMQSHREKKFTLKYECPVCAHMFHTKYHVQMHLNTHQKEGLIKEKNRNEVLAMVLQNARKFPKHPEGGPPEPIANEDRSRVCNICGEIFQHFYFLEEHLKSHGTKMALEDLNSEEEKKHICPVCNKGFKLHYYLKLHSFTHTKEKPFICQQCGKGFITRGKLKRHLETHTGIKKFQCHVCCKFFTRSSYLRIHVRTIHGTQDYNSRLGKGYIDRMDVF